MSFLDDIVDFASTAWDWFSGDSAGAQLTRSVASTALTGYALSQVTSAVNKQNEAPKQAAITPTVDPGVRLQIDPDPENRIPVVYGSAYLGGLITDAVLTNSNQTMYFCITICEKTGVKFSDELQSQFAFNNIYWNDSRVVFGSDGITVNSLVSRDGEIDTKPAGKIKIWCYNGSSSNPVAPIGYTNASLPNAYNVMPDWTSSHVMSDLIFAIVRVDYDKENEVTGLGNIIFNVVNNMTMPGDCLYDMMTSNRYGAALSPEEIYLQ
jgi:hypothetical protein